MLVDVALEVGTFVYRVPKKLKSQIKIGSLVRVPLRKTLFEGWVIGESQTSKVAPQNLKPIISVCFPTPLVSESLIELGKWMSSYYSCSLGAVLNLMVPEITTHEPVGGVKELRVEKTEPSLPLVINEALKQRRFKSVLLYGSDRNSIYLRTINKAVEYGMGAIFLVPEIKLTPGIFSLFQNRFGSLVALLHSGLKKDERWAEWLRIKEGKASIVVGTMSAVFAPVHNLGVIIIDEEHDPSYKSEKYPRYSTSVVSKMRAQIESCLHISGSSTPSIETFSETENKKSTLVRLVSKKRENKIFVVDMRKEVDPIFSDLLKRKLNEYVSRHKKILLFLNRRGFASFILCEDCGYIPKCHNCAISLTYHRQDLTLRCHYCNYKEKAPGYCVQCKGTNLSYKGVGTVRVEQAFKKLFPGVNIFRLDLDAVSSKYATHVFNSFIHGEIQVLLGTQFVSKPIEFPQVELIGIISSDIGLNLPDFRSPERTFSLLMRLIEKGRETVLQTHNPEHMVLKYLAKQDYISFYKYEKQARKEHNYPPYSHLIRILIEESNEVQATKKIKKIVSELTKKGIEYLGPSPCPFQARRGKFRVHFLLKVKNPTDFVVAEQLPSGTIIDVDPIDLL